MDVIEIKYIFLYKDLYICTVYAIIIIYIQSRLVNPASQQLLHPN